MGKTTKNPYESAALKYAPPTTHTLFVAEAPPSKTGRYFYFEKVRGGDWLWIALMKALYPQDWGDTKQERSRKSDWLLRFKQDGFRLIDAVKSPIGGTSHRRLGHIEEAADTLMAEIKDIAPLQIVLIKSTVHRALYRQFKDKGMPVVNSEPLPFPCSGQQLVFHEGLSQLITDSKLTYSQDNRT